jgi:hypothetical protein
MELPPGPRYVIGKFLRALPVSVAAYGILRVLVGFLVVSIPRWLPLVVLLVTHPAVNFVMDRWRVYKIRIDAAAYGAVLVPQVAEGGAVARDLLVNSMLSGYIGACCIVRCLVY